MRLRSLRADGIRILQHVDVEFGDISIFFGENGSGKTSILEAVSLLGTGRSFRSARIEPVINHDRESCTVFGSVVDRDPGAAPVAIGITRHRSGQMEAQVGGHRVSSSARLAERLPLLHLTSDSFGLVEGGPRLRRHFLDWGVFHVEHRFHDCWLAYQRALKQRNSLLRRGKIAASELAPWNERLAQSGEQLDRYRSRWFSSFEPLLQQTLRTLNTSFDLEAHYSRGWDTQQTLEQALERSTDTDLRRAFTGPGPQRADIRLRIGADNAADLLSRGQQKLAVTALKIAQGRLLKESGRRPAVYLVDDLPAELDLANRKALCRALVEMEAQVLITCVEPEDLAECWDGLRIDERAMFHVEHGRVAHME